jgi:Zn-dependent protease with chaperone function
VNGVPGWLLPAAGVWIGGFLVLLAAGWVLSGAALRAARQVPAALEGGVRGFDALLRRVYQVVLWLCCGYYWVSIPILFVLVAALGGVAVYGILNLGHIPLMLLATIVLGTLGTLWAIVRSLFVRGSREDPGERLDLGRYAGLRGMLDEVAERVGTRPVDNVYLTPGTEVAVMERGRGLLARARGLIAGGGPARERCLILGAGVLEGMRLGPLKAVLAHEYGHFSNRDTAGGGFALAVRRSLVVMGQTLARRGAAWYNPAWLFVNGFYRIFLRISQGASRLQEVLADRWAALLYGSRAFEQGLRHVVEQSVRFDAHAGATVNEVVMEKRELPNLYAYRPTVAPAEAEVDRAVQQAVAAPPSPYDSHPSPADRMAWVRALAAPGAGASQDDERPAWTLFPDRDAIERRMTAAIRDNIRAAHGIAIPAAGGS